MGITGRVALVTGSGSGIGHGIARQLARAGATVAINDINAGRVAAVASVLRAEGATVLEAPGDVTRRDEVQAMISKVSSDCGRLDILVNNVGIARDRSIQKLSEEDWDTVIAVNLKSQFLCCQAAVAPMRSQGYGRIINISSRAWLGWHGQSNYAASKGGVVSLTRSLAMEVAKYGITVNCIAPGLIDTPLVRNMGPEIMERLIKIQPTGTIGTPDDVGWAALFFAADESHYITGQVLYVCGGKSLFASLSV